jgi:hypothetical protein
MLNVCPCSKRGHAMTCKRFLGFSLQHSIFNIQYSIFALLLLSCSTHPVTPVSPTADWGEAEGQAIVSNEKPHARARAKAIYRAEEEARSRVKAHFKDAPVGDGRTVFEAMASDEYCWSRIMGLLAATESYEQIDQDDGSVIVRMKVDMDYVRRICLHGEEAGALGPR